MSKRKITKTERRKAAIVAFLEKNPGAQRGAIMDGARGLSSVNKQIVTNTLGALRKAGSIRREGSRKSTRWFVVSPDEPREVRVEPLGLGPRTFENNYSNTMKRLKNALLGIDAHVALLEETLAGERSQPRVDSDYADLRSAVRNFLDGKTTVADLRKALGEDE